MKTILLTLLSIFFFQNIADSDDGNTSVAFKNGEFLKYRVHYTGLTAGYATLNVNTKTYQSSEHYHAVGKGWTSGVSKFFFKVNDRYETYINSSNLLPSKFIRKIDEGGYTKNKEIFFDQNSKKVTVNNKKKKSTMKYSVPGEVQDMLSAFYYLRKYSPNELSTGTVKQFRIFMDEEIVPFQVKVLGRETINTDFGKVKTIKMRPYVQSGRVFKEKESLTFWVTDDKNLVPILVKAELAVGSLKAEIFDYQNLKSDIHFF